MASLPSPQPAVSSSLRQASKKVRLAFQNPTRARSLVA